MLILELLMEKKVHFWYYFTANFGQIIGLLLKM